MIFPGIAKVNATTVFTMRHPIYGPDDLLGIPQSSHYGQTCQNCRICQICQIV